MTKSATRATTPLKSPSVGRAAAIPPAVVGSAPRVSDPGWVAPLRAALLGLSEACDRHRHAIDRLPIVQRAVAEARAALSREEAAGALEPSRRAEDGEGAARHALETAEAEAARALRIEAALAVTVEERRDALLPLLEPARVGLEEWTNTELARLDEDYRAAISNVAAIAAQALAIADNVGDSGTAGAILRHAWTAGLIGHDPSDVIRIGQEQGKVMPEATASSRNAAALLALLDAARAAAGTTTATTGREAA